MKNCASALPVVNGNGSFVGMLTDEDLLIRLKNRRRSFWQTVFADGAELAREYQKAVGTTVRDVMRPAPAPVDPETSLQSAAERLEQAGTGVLPVLADGRLVGSVSCTDLLAVVEKTLGLTRVARTDAELITEMSTRLAAEDWVSRGGGVIEARNGVISLYGLVDTEEQCAALGVMARAIEGCAGVENSLVTRSELPRSSGVV